MCVSKAKTDRRINPPLYQRFAEADGRALLMGKAWIPPRLSRRVKQGGGVIPSTFMHLVLRAFAAFSLVTFVFSLFNRVLTSDELRERLMSLG